MSSAYCVQEDCTRLIYIEKINGRLEPFVREFCSLDGEASFFDFNLDGTPRSDVGETFAPEDITLERREMCDGTTNFIRWFVYVMSDPTLNFEYNTTPDGVAYTPTGGETLGDCDAIDGCETVSYYAVNNSGKTIEPYRLKFCPNRAEPIYYDKDGEIVLKSTITGELFPEPDVNIEHRLMCDEGTTFVRIFVYVGSDSTQNFFYDKTLAGAAFTATGAETYGDCNAGDDCEMLPYYAVNGATKDIAPYRIKYCPGKEPVYYDKTDAEVQKSTISGTLVPISDVDIEHQLMCDGTTTFIRVFVYIKTGVEMNFYYDRTLYGASYTVADTVKAGACPEVDDCETRSFYVFANNSLTPILAKYCPLKAPAYFNPDGSDAAYVPADGDLVYPEDVNVEQVYMCAGQQTFIRSYVYIKGMPTSLIKDIDLDGVDYTPDAGGTVKAGVCPECGSVESQELCDTDLGVPTILPINAFEQGTESRQYLYAMPQGIDVDILAARSNDKFRVLYTPGGWGSILNFSENVDVILKIQFRSTDGSDDSDVLKFSEPVELLNPQSGIAYSAGSSELTLENSQAGTAVVAEIRLNDVNSLGMNPKFSVSTNQWFINEIVVYSPRGTGVHKFIQKKITDCDGVITTEDVDFQGNPYVVIGQVSAC